MNKCQACQKQFLQHYTVTYKNGAKVSDLNINGYELAKDTGLWPGVKIIKVEQT